MFPPSWARNFSDGRGNVTIGFETYKREAPSRSTTSSLSKSGRVTDTGGLFAGLARRQRLRLRGPGLPVIGTVNALFNDRRSRARVFSPNGAQNGVGRGFNFNADGDIS